MRDLDVLEAQYQNDARFRQAYFLGAAHAGFVLGETKPGPDEVLQ